MQEFARRDGNLLSADNNSRPGLGNGLECDVAIRLDRTPDMDRSVGNHIQIAADFERAPGRFPACRLENDIYVGVDVREVVYRYTDFASRNLVNLHLGAGGQSQPAIEDRSFRNAYLPAQQQDIAVEFRSWPYLHIPAHGAKARGRDIPSSIFRVRGKARIGVIDSLEHLVVVRKPGRSRRKHAAHIHLRAIDERNPGRVENPKRTARLQRTCYLRSVPALDDIVEIAALETQRLPVADVECGPVDQSRLASEQRQCRRRATARHRHIAGASGD